MKYEDCVKTFAKAADMFMKQLENIVDEMERLLNENPDDKEDCDIVFINFKFPIHGRTLLFASYKNPSIYADLVFALTDYLHELATEREKLVQEDAEKMTVNIN